MNHDNIIDTTATEVPPIDPIAARLAPIASALVPHAPTEVRRAALDPLREIYAEICASLDGGTAPPSAGATITPPAPYPVRGMSIDQVLDLAIAQLRPIVAGGPMAADSPLAQLLGSLR